MVRYYLPKEDFPNPEQFIDDIIENRFLNNIRLWLDKYCFFDEGKNKFDLESQIKLLRNGKLAISSNMINLQNYENYLQRINSLYESLKKQGYYFTEPYEGRIEWRLVVGLGHESVYETSIMLHRNYSVPIIPGSAVKGLVHHYAEKYKKLFKDEIIEIFGSQNKKGRVIFFDALPIIEQNKDFIVLDVMNVHYRDYYQDESGGTPPGDWMNPSPVFFLAVEGIKFKFVVASRDSNLAERVMRLLKEAVKKIGIGAKTSAGYGYFE
ncbi:hypothetical protein DRP04_06735 [Archaeoglobales archaeon]|nr:MAG: hypothetical protein DRP04_06735 [Archaeoglobales archaeon]